jgi:hypothetical protein
MTQVLSILFSRAAWLVTALQSVIGFSAAGAAAEQPHSEEIATKVVSSETALRRRLAEDPDSVLRALGVDPTLFDLNNAERQGRTLPAGSAVKKEGIRGSARSFERIAASPPVAVYGPPPAMIRPKPPQSSDKTDDGTTPSPPASSDKGLRSSGDRKPDTPAPVYGPPPGRSP